MTARFFNGAGGSSASVVGVGVLALVVAFLGSPLRSEGVTERIGIVDLERVVDSFKKTESLKEGLRQQIEPMLEAVKTRERELKKEEEELQFLNPASPDFKTKSQALRVEKFRLRMQAEDLEADWNARVVKAYRVILEDIEKEIASLARDKGLAAVLRVGGVDLTGAEADEKDVVFKLKLKNILYHDPSLDLTDEVLARLNT
jgi:Skp family chaperone for outer membrane proteins